MELKYLSNENVTDMARLWRYSFDPEENSFNNLKTAAIETLASRTLGLFVDGNLKSTATNLDYEIFLRGNWLKIAAVAGVATAPECRRQGLIKEVMKRLFMDIKKQGQAVSGLYPFSLPFYEKLGYRMASQTDQISFPAREIRKRPVKGITVKLVDGPEENKKVYSKAVENYNLIFRRTDKMWTEQFKDEKGYNYVFYQGEEPVGYVKLFFPKYDGEMPSRKNAIAVKDYFWNSPLVRQAVFNFLHDHDSQREYILMREIEPLAIYLFLKDCRTLERKTSPGMMFRVVDVKKALESVVYPVEYSGKCAFAITDKQCPWNNKNFLLEVNDGAGSVKIIEAVDIDFEADIGPFSQLFSGFFSYQKLVDAGEINRTSSSNEPGRIFPEMYNLPRDFF
ncbi:MAG: GNAT family N-acetyltransferase [Candidatus Hodarchaeales archaeon]